MSRPQRWLSCYAYAGWPGPAPGSVQASLWSRDADRSTANIHRGGGGDDDGCRRLWTARRGTRRSRERHGRTPRGQTAPLASFRPVTNLRRRGILIFPVLSGGKIDAGRRLLRRERAAGVSSDRVWTKWLMARILVHCSADTDRLFTALRPA